MSSPTSLSRIAASTDQWTHQPMPPSTSAPRIGHSHRWRPRTDLVAPNDRDNPLTSASRLFTCFTVVMIASVRVIVAYALSAPLACAQWRIRSTT